MKIVRTSEPNFHSQADTHQHIKIKSNTVIRFLNLPLVDILIILWRAIYYIRIFSSQQYLFSPHEDFVPMFPNRNS